MDAPKNRRLWRVPLATALFFWPVMALTLAIGSVVHTLRADHRDLEQRVNALENGNSKLKPYRTSGLTL